MRIIFLALLICTELNGQPTEMERFIYNLGNKISIGSSPSEIKTLIGKPFAVQPGYPTEREIIIEEMPSHIGQLNYTSWYYKYSPKKLTIDSYRCFINGKEVDEYIYDYYKDSTIIYFMNERIISPQEAWSYKLYKNQDLKWQEKNYATTYKKGDKPIGKSVFIPIVCIIFDRGTQVVSDVRKYLLWNKIK